MFTEKIGDVKKILTSTKLLKFAHVTTKFLRVFTSVGYTVVCAIVILIANRILIFG